MNKEEVLAEMQRHFRGEDMARARKYVGGLLPAICDFLIELRTHGQTYASFEAILAEFPLVTSEVSISTLTVQLPGGGQKTIRPAYDRYHNLYIFKHHRLDYPRSEPYATGKWVDYRHWLDAMAPMSDEDLRWLAEQSVAFVLAELPDQSFDPTKVRSEPPIFKWLLERFDFNARAKGELSGAAFQAAVFGYIRADAPHLQIEARKTRAGSARTKGIGDIDAWEGDQLIISAEVKSFVIANKQLEGLTHFAANIAERGALGLVVAHGFDAGVRETLATLGLTALSRADILAIVAIWDPLKQRAALNAFQWAVTHVEQNSGLINRVAMFLGNVRQGEEHGLPASEPVPSDEHRGGSGSGVSG